MHKYLISIPWSKDDHWDSQAGHLCGIFATGIHHDDCRWICGWEQFGIRYHDWKIKCTQEQLALLKLSLGANVKKDLTIEYRVSGLAKLNDEEKEALGLT